MDRNMKPKSPHKLSNIIQFNPTERLAKGTLAKKVPMEYLQPYTRAISDYETAEYSGGSKFRNGDTLMARITPCLENGKTAYASILDDGEVGFGSTEYIVFRNIEGVTDSKFVYYFVTSPWFREIAIKSMVGSSGRQRVQQSVLENLEVTLPPLEEQRRIAGILGSLDDKIELNRRINANLEAQAQALFRSWFVDFEPFRDGPFVDSELGKIPQGWKIGTLSEIGDVIGGGTPSKIKPEYYTDNGIAWITPKDLSTNNCKFTSKGETDISELGYKNSSAKLMPRGSVLFSSRAPIGYISIAKNEICTNQGFKSIVPKKAGTCFIYYFLRNNTSKIESMASGSTFKEASGGLMKSLEVIIPSNKILTAFEEAIQPLFNMQEHNEDENARLSALRDILLPKLMAGEINLH